MKKTLLTTALALLLMSTVSNGQVTFQPKTFQYCELSVATKYLSEDVRILAIVSIDYGQANVVGQDLQDKNRSFTGVAEILNYMDSQDWEFVSIDVIYGDHAPDLNNNHYTYHLLFKRKVDALIH